LSTLSDGQQQYNCAQVLQYHDKLALAAACHAQRDRGWPASSQSMESNGMEPTLPLPEVFQLTISKLYNADRRHIMPVITPMYPAMCATHNVTHSTFKVIKREMSRAKNIMNAISAKKLSWTDLFQRHTFFSEDYKYYLSIVSASPTKDAQLKWSGRVQSKVRMLVASLETSESGVEIAHPFNKGFDREHHCKNDDEKGAVFQGSIAYQVPGTKTETTDELNIIKAESGEIPNSETVKNEDGSISIYTTTFYIGIELKEGKLLKNM